MKKTLAIMLVFVMTLLCSVCYAEGISFEVEETNVNANMPNEAYSDCFVYFSKEDGFITTINGEQFYVNNYKKTLRGSVIQKVYSMNAFNYFKNSFQNLFLYEKTDNGYIVCTPAYRIGMQSYMWNGTVSHNAYLYDDDLNLIKQADFSDYVYCVDFIDGYYYVYLFNGGFNRYNDPINLSCKKTSNFLDWIDCKEPTSNKISNYDIVYENGAKFGSGDKMGSFYKTIRNQDGIRNSILSPDGIYSLNLDFQIYSECVYWEDSLYLYINTSGYTYKTLKLPLYDELEQLKNKPYVMINDIILAFEVPPVIENGSMLVPMRFLFGQLGAKVEWDNETQTAKVVQNADNISFQIDNKTARVNNQQKMMDVPARLVGGKTMIPLRFLSENLGYTVDWDENARMAIITN